MVAGCEQADVHCPCMLTDITLEDVLVYINMPRGSLIAYINARIMLTEMSNKLSILYHIKFVVMQFCI